MSIRNLFFNPQEDRLRSGWRIVFFFLLYFSVTFLVALPVGLLAGTNLDVTNPRDLLLASMVGGIAIAIGVYLSRRSIDRKSVESLGLDQTRMWPDMLAGTLIGGAMVALVYALLLLSGALEFVGFAWQVDPFATWALALLNLSLAFVLTGISEEVMMRGYIFQNLEEGLGTAGAVLLSSGLFAALHIGNPGGAHPGAVAGIFLAGLFFAYAYLRTRSLWLAIGLHIGWNLFLNAVFGFVVSGVDAPGLIRHTVAGPELWTGGRFGPEAGLVLVPALALGTLLVYLLFRNR